jgi:hypothetical protein
MCPTGTEQVSLDNRPKGPSGHRPRRQGVQHGGMVHRGCLSGSKSYSRDCKWPRSSTPPNPNPPQTIILSPVQTAVKLRRAVGRLTESSIATHSSLSGVYKPPEFNMPVVFAPPQTTIWSPVHTAEWSSRSLGAPFVPTAFQVSVFGSYLPPVFKNAPTWAPSHTIIRVPVHTAVWLLRDSGALI